METFSTVLSAVQQALDTPPGSERPKQVDEILAAVDSLLSCDDSKQLECDATVLEACAAGLQELGHAVSGLLPAEQSSAILVVESAKTAAHRCPAVRQAQRFHQHTLTLVLRAGQLDAITTDVAAQHLNAALIAAKQWFATQDYQRAEDCLLSVVPCLEHIEGLIKAAARASDVQTQDESGAPIDEDIVALWTDTLLLHTAVVWLQQRHHWALIPAQRCVQGLCAPGAQGPVLHPSCLSLCVEVATCINHLTIEQGAVTQGDTITAVLQEQQPAAATLRVSSSKASTQLLELARQAAAYAYEHAKALSSPSTGGAHASIAHQARHELTRTLDHLASLYHTQQQSDLTLECLSALEALVPTDACGDEKTRAHKLVPVTGPRRLDTYVQAGRVEDALKELMVLVSHPDIPLNRCMTAMISLLHGHQGPTNTATTGTASHTNSTTGPTHPTSCTEPGTDMGMIPATPAARADAACNSATPTTPVPAMSVPAAQLLPALRALLQRAAAHEVCEFTLHFLLQAGYVAGTCDSGGPIHAAAQPAATAALTAEQQAIAHREFDALLITALSVDHGDEIAKRFLLAVREVLRPCRTAAGAGAAAAGLVGLHSNEGSTQQHGGQGVRAENRLTGTDGNGLGSEALVPGGTVGVAVVIAAATTGHMEATEGGKSDVLASTKSETGGANKSERDVSHLGHTAAALAQELFSVRGVTRWNGGDLKLAQELVQASRTYATPLQDVEACKVLTLSCMASKQLDRALATLHDAERALSQVSPPSYTQDPDTPMTQDGSGSQGAPLPVFIPFLALKVHLERGDVYQAQGELQRLVTCVDYSPALLEVVCQEACRISAFPVAISALRTLHHHILSGDAVPGVVESDVLRCHVSCLEKQLPRQPHSRGDKAHEASEGKMGAGDSETVDVLGSLAQLMNQASKRLDTVGYEGFFKGDKSTRSEDDMRKMLEWFARAGLRLGEKAGLCQCLEPMAVFYVATHSMLAHHPKPTPDTLRMRCAAAILATIAATAVARDNPAKRDASLHFARRMLALSRELNTQCRALPEDTTERTDSETADMNRVEGLLVYYELFLGLMLSDVESVEHILCEKVTSTPMLTWPTASQLLELATLARGEDYLNLSAARALYERALDQLTAQEPRNGTEFLQVIRAHLDLCETGDERLSALQRAHELMSRASDRGTQQGHVTFPAEYVEWLVATGWNQGANHARFGRHAEALKFMQAVRDLLKFSPAEYQEQHTARMSEHMTAIQNSTSITPLAQGLQQVITAAHV